MAVEAKINIVLVFDIAYFTKAGITNDEGMAQEYSLQQKKLLNMSHVLWCSILTLLLI